MTGKSFFDLDYIIGINEQRLEQYTAAYEKVMEKLTNIIGFVFYFRLLSVRLILPNKLPCLLMPKRYYVQNQEQYAQEISDQMAMENILKANYISELELLTSMYLVCFKRKTLFHRNALVFALFSVLPYLGCFGFYIAHQKDDAIQKIEIVNEKLKLN